MLANHPTATAGPDVSVFSVDLLEEIGRRREARLASRSKAYPRTHPIASDVDPDSCLRRQVLEVVRWEDKPLFEAKSMARFEVGVIWENEAIINLKRDGFEVVAEQTPFQLNDRRTGVPVLRGRIDGKIRWNGKDVPFEVKSMNPNVYARMETLDDLLRFWWTKKYIAQLLAYLIGHGHEWGFFYLTDCLGNWKAIRVDLDYAKAEAIWAFGETIVAAISEARSSGALPTYSSDPTECARCPFFKRACQPDIIEQGATMLDDPELLAIIDRWHELKPLAREFEGLDKQVKGRIKAAEIERGIAGNYVISVTKRPVKEYTVKARVDKYVSIEPLSKVAQAIASEAMEGA